MAMDSSLVQSHSSLRTDLHSSLPFCKALNYQLISSSKVSWKSSISFLLVCWQPPETYLLHLHDSWQQQESRQHQPQPAESPAPQVYHVSPPSHTVTSCFQKISRDGLKRKNQPTKQTKNKKASTPSSPFKAAQCFLIAGGVRCRKLGIWNRHIKSYQNNSFLSDQK